MLHSDSIDGQRVNLALKFVEGIEDDVLESNSAAKLLELVHSLYQRVEELEVENRELNSEIDELDLEVMDLEDDVDIFLRSEFK